MKSLIKSRRRDRASSLGGRALVATCFGLVIVSAALAAAAANQQEVNVKETGQRLQEVDTAIISMQQDLAAVAEGYRTPLHREGRRLQRRLREAEVQSLLGDHYRAAIVLFDITDRPELKTDPQYGDAIFLLAESLRKSGHPGIAQGFYMELIPIARPDRLAKVILGLLEVASMTGDFSLVEPHVERLKARGGMGQEAAQIDFTYGKALFRGASAGSERLDRALRQFKAVPGGLSVSAPAAYYAGVTLVQKGMFQEALREFERALSLASFHPTPQRVSEMAYLSMGRLQQELGNKSGALDAYQGITRDSPFFAEMLLEVAWAHVSAAESAQDEKEENGSLQRALDALELMKAAAPDSRLVPNARVLQGNIQIRLGAPESAYATFQELVDRFDGARTELDGLLTSRKDARAFFEELVSADLERLDQTSLLPPMVVRFAMENDEIADAVEVRKDLAVAYEDIQATRQLVRTLEVALKSEQRFGMFPALRSARLRALSVQNRLLGAERLLIEVERKVMSPQLDEASLARLDALRMRARDVEADIVTLPTTDAGIEGNRAALQQAYESVAHRAFRQLSRARAMRAQLVAVQLWMRDQAIELGPKERSLTDERIDRAGGEIAALEEAIEAIQNDIERAAVLSRGDGGWARAERLRGELYAAIDAQTKVMMPHRQGLPVELRGIVVKIDEQRAALRQLERDLRSLQTRLEQVVDARVDEVRQQVITELKAVDTHRSEYLALSGRADQLLGPVAEATVSSVGQEFRDLILKADVGILDVAWARKRARTDKVTEMVRELRRRSSELEEEFAEVLEDE